MKYILFILLVGFLFIFSANHVYAETSVNIENNGDGASSDVHVENSTDNGSSSTTVCINGKCETTQGNVDRQEGGAKVKVENKASGSAQKSQQQQLNLDQILTNIRNFFSELFQ